MLMQSRPVVGRTSLFLFAYLLPLVANFPPPAAKDMKAIRRTRWVPVVEKRSSMRCDKSITFEEGLHFRLVRREAGRERADLPIWTPIQPNLVPYDDAAAGPIVRTDVPEVPGAFLLSHVIADSECAALKQVTSAQHTQDCMCGWQLSYYMGFTTDAHQSASRVTPS